MAGIVGTIYGKRKGLGRTLSLNASERTGTALRPKVALPALFPRGPAPYAQMVMFARLTHSAALPSLLLPPPRSLSHFSVYLLSRGGRATARTRPPSHSLPPSLPRSLRVIGDGVRHCGVCVGVGGGLRPLSVRPSGGWRGGLARAPRTCLSAIRRRILVCLKARSYSKSGALQRWIPGYRRCTDRPTVQPN